MATAEIVVEQEPIVRSWVLPKHIPELDGLRAIAILLVLVHHQAFWMASSTLRSVIERGVVGVDLFFVLSGFLITGILLDSQGQRHAARNFYVRRGLRIWPLYFSLLAVAMLLFRRMMPVSFAFWPYLLLTQNFFYFTSMGPILEPTWSLAVEEQFYFIWPWIVLRCRRETVMKLCATVLALSPIVRFGLRMAGANPRFLYVNTLCRLDPIAMGALIAAWTRGADFYPNQSRYIRLGLAIGTVGWLACSAEPGAPLSVELRPSFLAIAFGAVLSEVLAAQNSQAIFARVLRRTWLRFVARTSFALYLFNLPVYSIMHGNFCTSLCARFPSPLGEVSLFAASNTAVFMAAALSWRFFEGPILRLKDRFAAKW